MNLNLPDGRRRRRATCTDQPQATTAGGFGRGAKKADWGNDRCFSDQRGREEAGQTGTRMTATESPPVSSTRLDGELASRLRRLAPHFRVQLPLAHADVFRRYFHELIGADVLDAAVEGHDRVRGQAHADIRVDERILVRCFILQTFTSRSVSREFLPTIMPSYTSMLAG